jgi:protein O-mannosyl-transferase
MAPHSPLTWTLSGFLEHFRFVHTNMRDHAYAWVLGAGASKPSGIPLAGELVQRWLGELQLRFDTRGQTLSEWATAETLGIPKFEYQNAASHYSKVYEKRFSDNPDEGFAYLEDLMSGKDPSPGYSILAQILEKTQHKVCVSTNFDNLVADALSIYTSTFPLIIGHESLTGFVKVVSRRPVICKIHRDLLLAPKNDTRSLRRLHESWAAALRALFSQFTPLFIGYGGNDDSLMDLLESLDPHDIKGQMIWCYYERSEPSERIQELVIQHRGALVPVPDFDILMILLGAGMGLQPTDDAIEERAKKRAQKYRQRLIALETASYPAVRRALQGAFARAGGSLPWREQARNEPSTDRREAIYRQARELHPNDEELLLDMIDFLHYHDRGIEEARAIAASLQEKDAQLDYYPSFHRAMIAVSARDFDTAEQTLKPVPDSHSLKLFAMATLREAQGNPAEAEQHLRNMANSGDLLFQNLIADFLWRQGRMNECEQVLRRAYANDATDADTVINLALFIWLIRNDVKAAGILFSEIPGLQRISSHNLCHAACFFLAVGDARRLGEMFTLLESRPMDNSIGEKRMIFLRLLDEIIQGGDGRARIRQLHPHLARTIHRIVLSIPVLTGLVRIVESKIPVEQRPFLVTLAEAIYDPAYKPQLEGFSQWSTAFS